MLQHSLIEFSRELCKGSYFPHFTESSPGHRGEKSLPEVTELILVNRDWNPASSVWFPSPGSQHSQITRLLLNLSILRAFQAQTSEASAESSLLDNFSNLPA